MAFEGTTQNFVLGKESVKKYMATENAIRNGNP
jgi:hypothetical protein